MFFFTLRAGLLPVRESQHVAVLVFFLLFLSILTTRSFSADQSRQTYKVTGVQSSASAEALGRGIFAAGGTAGEEKRLWRRETASEWMEADSGSPA